MPSKRKPGFMFIMGSALLFVPQTFVVDVGKPSLFRISWQTLGTWLEYKDEHE